MLGKLKRTLKEKCPDCGKVLQLREKQEQTLVNGLPATIAIEYICCSNKRCDYEEDVEQKERKNIEIEI